MNRRYILAGLLLTAILGMMAIGCGSKVTKDNYDKIKEGMTLSEVEAILGKGEKQAGGSISIGDIGGTGDVYVWKDEQKEIKVTFRDGKAVAWVQSGL